MCTIVVNDEECVIKRLSQESIPDIMKCLTKISAPYNERTVFIPPTREYLCTILSGYGQSAGIYVGNDLIAFASIVFPKTGNHNLGHILKMTNTQLRKVIQLEHSFVHPQFRGNGIVNKLWFSLIHPLENNYDYLLSTISPQNTASLAAAFKRRQRIVSLTDVYGETRYVLFRSLHNEPQLQKRSLCIPISNLNSIKEKLQLLYQGWAITSNHKALLFAKVEKHEEI